MFSLICIWINGWVYNREAGDLRRYLAHYDVIVMWRVFRLFSCIPSTHATIYFKTLWLSDAKWWHRAVWTLAQVMACCLTAPNYYLNRCWIIMNEVLWHSITVMGAMASQITSVLIDRGPVNFPHRRLVTWKMSPFDDAIMHSKVMFTWTLKILIPKVTHLKSQPHFQGIMS